MKIISERQQHDETQVKITLFHPDEVSGLTVLSDETRIYWTEGRSSEIHIVYPDGRKESIGVWQQHPLVDLVTGDAVSTAPGRPMTPEEATQYEQEYRDGVSESVVKEDLGNEGTSSWPDPTEMTIPKLKAALAKVGVNTEIRQDSPIQEGEYLWISPDTAGLGFQAGLFIIRERIHLFCAGEMRVLPADPEIILSALHKLSRLFHHYEKGAEFQEP